MATVDELLAQGYARLSTAQFQPPRRELRLLLSKVLGWTEAAVMSHGETMVPAPAARRFRDLIARRLTGEPVAYLLNEREFFGRSFFVDSRVLIPRPETEHLIETVMSSALPSQPRILDLGTGSGCVAVTLACELPGAHLVAVDISPAAAAVARRNAALHRVDKRLTVLCGDLATALDLDRFDFVVSNPPYVSPGDSRVSPEVLGFEPTAAVFAPVKGESVIRRLLDELDSLRPDTPLCFEIGAGQAASIEALVRDSSFELIAIHDDLAGIPRTVMARKDRSPA